jgi:hypothetical protein
MQASTAAPSPNHLILLLNLSFVPARLRLYPLASINWQKNSKLLLQSLPT